METSNDIPPKKGAVKNLDEFKINRSHCKQSTDVILIETGFTELEFLKYKIIKKALLVTEKQNLVL